MIMNRKVVTGILALVLLSSCYYDKENELYGSCNTSNVTYSQTITRLLGNYACLNCHSAPTNNGAPFSLANYADVKAQVDANRLFGAINHDNGFAQMPQGLPKMSQCDINKVKAWIDAGAPNN
jgi:hypothetical protein